MVKNALLALAASILALCTLSAVPEARAGLDHVVGRVTLNPIFMKVQTAAPPAPVQSVRIRAEVKNEGSLKVTGASAHLILPEGLRQVGRSGAVRLHTIRPGGARTARWQVRAEQPGNYVVLVSFSGQLDGQTVAAEESMVVAVQEGRPVGKFVRDLVARLLTRLAGS